jgi:tape measure domain-containing protein
MVSTFETAGRSAAEATAEVDALRKSALAPGLDFEQAIAASIRLQGVGYSAEQARTSIEQMANAIALTGGTAQNLDSVTVQFSQMIAKGKVLAQDLRIIQENMPIVSRLMQQAFGTQNADALQKMGVSGKEFVDKITAAAAVLPRVQGGIKNAIVNAGAAARQALAQLGEEINKAFKIEGVSNAFVKALNSIVQAFAGLSDSSKRVIVIMAALAAAAGPAIFVLSRLVFVFGAARTGFLTASKAIAVFNANLVKTAGTAAASTGAFSGLTTGIQRAAAAFKALNVAQRTLLIGSVIAIIAAAVIAFNEFTRTLSATEQAQRAVAEVNDLAARETAVQRVEVTRLTKVIEDQNSTLAQKERALNKLKQISPEYYGSLTIAKGQVVGLTEATDAYVKSLIRVAVVEKAREKSAQLILDNEDLRAAMKERSSIADRFYAGPFVRGESAVVEARNKGLRAQILANEAQLKSLEALITKTEEAQIATGGLNDAGKKLGPTADEIGAAQKRATEKAKLYKDALASIAAVSQKGDVLGADVIGEQAKEIESQIERLIEGGFKPYGKEIQHLQELLRGLKSGPVAPFAALPTLPTPVSVQSVEPGAGVSAIAAAAQNASGPLENLLTVGEQLKATLDGVAAKTVPVLDAFGRMYQIVYENLTPAMQALASVGADAFSAIGESIASGAVAFSTFASSVLQSTAKAIGGILRLYVAQLLLKSAFFAANPFVALAIGGLVGGLASALFQRLAKQISAPKLSEGGVVRKPTLAMIGEYSGAASNPEIVAPESKLRNIFRQENGGQGYILSTNIAGNDLQLILERAQNRNQRIR